MLLHKLHFDREAYDQKPGTAASTTSALILFPSGFNLVRLLQSFDTILLANGNKRHRRLRCYFGSHATLVTPTSRTKLRYSLLSARSQVSSRFLARGYTRLAVCLSLRSRSMSRYPHAHRRSTWSTAMTHDAPVTGSLVCKVNTHHSQRTWKAP